VTSRADRPAAFCSSVLLLSLNPIVQRDRRLPSLSRVRFEQCLGAHVLRMMSLFASVR
jgi:hypothetical protein